MQRATALVIRGTDWSETSRIVTLFSREVGKIRGLAKGGRRIRSNFEVSFDLLSVCEIVYIHKAQGGLDLIIEAQLRERFPVLRSNLSAMYIGYYIAELLADGTADYDPHEALFEAALRMLRSLNDPTVDRLGAVCQFELVWLQETGYSPRLERCAACGGTLPDGRMVVSVSAGGLVCGACGNGHHDRRWLSAEARSGLLRLARGDTVLPAGVRGELRPLLGQMVSAVLGRRPKMLAYVDAVPQG